MRSPSGMREGRNCALGTGVSSYPPPMRSSKSFVAWNSNPPVYRKASTNWLLMPG